MKQKLTVGRLIERMREVLQLEHVTGTSGLDREISSPHVSSPGLALAGYTDRFASHRLQVMGETEITYLRSLGDDERRRILKDFFRFPIPCLFITKGQTPPAGLAEEATFAGIAVLCSALKTNEFYNRIKPWLEDEFAASTTLHASLADVFGVGLLFTGRSGIGKSECVLDLIERGHRLVADDLVLVSRRGNDVLIGRGHELQRHYMEIRGVGLVDIPAIFGIRAVRQQKRIEVIVQLEDWDADATIDRTGLDGETAEILDVQLPKVRVPLNPGKNITVICEVIAMSHLLKYSGVDPAERFNERLIKQMRAASEVRRYLQEDNE
ncbi:MAG TPA: HPr(Ser) kinase/phosphatase [Gemmatimonadaceae bacterium]|nr:HPr(Ser) kinase/phosphatase [Gemmatimonadaceae bacterium]